MPRNQPRSGNAMPSPPPPVWTQLPLLDVADIPLARSALIRVEVSTVLDGQRGLQEIGYHITNLASESTLALAHNVIPGCPWDDYDVFGNVARSQVARAGNLLLPF